MNKRLRDEDRIAVDMFLDANDDGGQPMAASASIAARIAAVEQTLRLLDAMPAVEPPDSLVDATLERIAQDPLTSTVPHRTGHAEHLVRRHA